MRVYADEGWGSGDYLEVLRDVTGRVEQAEVLVAVEGDRLLGSVTVATRGGPAAEQAGPGDAVVRMLVTGPAARRRGVGTALVAACLEAARRDGCTRVRLSTQRGMASAHRVYERFGFSRTPEDDWEPEPGPDAAHVRAGPADVLRRLRRARDARGVRGPRGRWSPRGTARAAAAAWSCR